jgi:polyhydroxyalkanoate synthesis regulator phasin
MPKKKTQETPAEQAERFQKEVERLIAAGELSPTDADAALDQLVKRAAQKA